jgi:peptidoglycan hydrolase-like protein with peptidoglycan-binding domain
VAIPFYQPDVNPPVNELRLDLAYFFPEITHFYGFASGPDHNTKRCLDAMVYDSTKKIVSAQGRNNLSYSDRIALGNRILVHLRENARHYGLNGVVWNRKVYGFPHNDAPFGRNHYRGPYNVARNYTASAHDDHLHIDQDGSSFKPLRDVGAPVPLGTVWVDVLAPGVTNSISIRLVQRALGVAQTGTYDAATVAAAKAYQESLGDDVDGWLGPKQVTRLFADKKMSVTVRLDASGQASKPATPPKPDPKPEPAPVTHTITGVNANFLRRTDPDDDRKEWAERIGNSIKHILSVKPSYVLGQELDSVTAADVAKRLGSVWRYQRLKGIAVFWDSEVFDFTEGRNIEHYFSTKDNRYFFGVPVKHKASGEPVLLSTSHFENNGDTKTDGEAVRKVQATEVAARTKTGRVIFGADLNSTTLSSGSNGVKPRVILGKSGLTFLTDQKGVTNRTLASHHGGKSSTPKGPWIDDIAWRGFDFVKGSLIRTDATDASDHHFLAATLKF